MLKTTGSSIASASTVDDNEVVSGNGGVGVDARSVGGSDASKKSTKSKSQIKSRHLGNSNDSEELKFLTSGARKAFNCLKQAFTKALILQYFDPKCHIRIETNASSYAIRKVLSQLTLN